jgi:integrase
MGKRGNGEGSIYRQKDNLWAACITLDTDKGRKRKYFYGKTRKEVQEKLASAQHERQQGTLITAPSQTVEQFLTHWLTVHKTSVRARTYERYEGFVRLHVVPGIGRVQLQKLSAQHLQGLYAKKLEEKLSPTTVNSLHMMLHRALKDAVRWGLIARNVCDLVSPPRKAKYEFQPLTVEQVNRLLEATRGHYMEALFKLALVTGMRRGELMGLKWQDIDFANGTLQVRRILTRVPTPLPGKGFVEAEPKTQKSRRNIVIAPLALEALKQHHTRQLEAKLKVGPVWQDHDYVFCTSIGTHLNPTRDILDELKVLLQKAGLPDIRFHDLRHSAATLLLSAGVHPKVVQEILGHSNISMTMDVYSHVLPTMQREAMNKLNDTLQG